MKKNILLCGAFFIAFALSAHTTSVTTGNSEHTIQYSVNNNAHITEDNSQNVNNAVDDVDDSVKLPAYTDKQLEILALIIYQEAGGDMCSDDTRRKVGSVFLNRVNCSLFPGTFEGVATQKSQYGTLSRTGIKWPDRSVNAGERHAVDRAYRIAEELLVGGSILPANVVFQAEFIQGDGTYCYQDDTYFCYLDTIDC